MRVGLEFAAAGVVNGKIYVMGDCVVDSWTRAASWAEALDPRTGTWVAVPSPDEVRDKWMHASTVVDGMEESTQWLIEAGSCMILGGSCGLQWRVSLTMGGEEEPAWSTEFCIVMTTWARLGDSTWGEGTWKELKGVEKGLPRFLWGATMANMGGNLVVVWGGKEKIVRNGKEMKVWCAEIEVKKDWDGELVGSIRWSERVLTVPARSSIVHCVAVAL